jgi:hypothetical protein
MSMRIENTNPRPIAGRENAQTSQRQNSARRDGPGARSALVDAGEMEAIPGDNAAGSIASATTSICLKRDSIRSCSSDTAASERRALQRQDEIGALIALAATAFCLPQQALRASAQQLLPVSTESWLWQQQVCPAAASLAQHVGMLPATGAPSKASTSNARAIRCATLQAIAADFPGCVRKTDVLSTSLRVKVKHLCPELPIPVHLIRSQDQQEIIFASPAGAPSSSAAGC